MPSTFQAARLAPRWSRSPATSWLSRDSKLLQNALPGAVSYERIATLPPDCTLTFSHTSFAPARDTPAAAVR